MRIILGVGGGIAAYKSAELVRALQRRNHDVQVVLTDAAQQFITPLTFAALTGRRVITGLFPPDGNPESALSSAVEHIGVAQENDILVVAPATANLLASFAHGIASDFLTTLYLAFSGKVVLAPAMNVNMWNHAATQSNVSTLRERGHVLVDPAEGWLACGMVGAGRLAEPEQIAETVDQSVHQRRELEGETVLVTAGPTQEPIDPVRYITNRSSGKMGYAIAAAALARGAQVILVSGPVELKAPPGVTLVRVRTAEQMRNAVMQHLPDATIIVKTAAVADYRVSTVSPQKLKKTGARLFLELDPTPDILAEVAEKKGDRLLIGFAAETEHLAEEARRKLKAKKCDMVVANLVGSEGTGFEADENEVFLVTAVEPAIHVDRAPKREIADRILDQVPMLRLAIHAGN
jgi:phosphopantothenoylcysteine decarboxylase/phosphopantothenate--cysteine ligase